MFFYYYYRTMMIMMMVISRKKDHGIFTMVIPGLAICYIAMV